MKIWCFGLSLWQISCSSRKDEHFDSWIENLLANDGKIDSKRLDKNVV